MIQCRAGSDAIEGAAISSTPPPIHATVPACQTSRISLRSRGGSMVACAKTLVSPSTPWISATAIAAKPEHCSKRSRIGSVSIHDCMVAMMDASECQYSCVWWIVARIRMADQLSARDWLDQGLKTLARDGFTALKAEPLAKAMGVSRGSFSWHFADIGAFHAAILKHWREIAAEQIIANLEAAASGPDALAILLRRVFSERPALE